MTILNDYLNETWLLNDSELVGGLVAIFYFPHILGIIIPID